MQYEHIVLISEQGINSHKAAAALTALDSRFTIGDVITTSQRSLAIEPNLYTHVPNNQLGSRTAGALFTHQINAVKYALMPSTNATINIYAVAAVDTTLGLLDDSSRRIAESAQRIKNELECHSFMVIFIDENPTTGAQNTPPDIDIVKSSSHYVIRKFNDQITPQLIEMLFETAGIGGMVPAHMIRMMTESNMLLINTVESSISGASYDLLLGDEYFYSGKIRKLSDENPILLIEPYDYAIVTSNEIAQFPRDISGRFDLAVSLFCQGIILSNGPQVDPGFSGPLFCLLFNTSNSPVLLKRRCHYATIEFHKLIEPTFGYKGEHSNKGLLHYLPSNATQGAINKLKQEIEQVRQDSRRFQDIVFTVVAIILAIVAIIVSMK